MMMAERQAVACIECEWWFDTNQGWRATKGALGLPICPRCGALLVQKDYGEFLRNTNISKEELMSWQDGGSFWKEKEER